MGFQAYSAVAVFFTLIMPTAFAVEYDCPAKKKVSIEHDYTKGQIEKWKFSTRLIDNGKTAIVKRCSYSSTEKKVTCDSYKVDRIEHDENVGIKKYYVFRSHYNFQVFRNLNSVEDNGRGDIQFGKCTVISP